MCYLCSNKGYIGCDKNKIQCKCAIGVKWTNDRRVSNCRPRCNDITHEIDRQCHRCGNCILLTNHKNKHEDMCGNEW